jgi:hypothetical protein
MRILEMSNYQYMKMKFWDLSSEILLTNSHDDDVHTFGVFDSRVVSCLTLMDSD